jgi:uncharacterized paraquat-inducible protein A
MNPLNAAVIAALYGKRLKCSRCGKLQAIPHLGKNERYHCKKCGHAFSAKELQSSSRNPH